MTNVERWKQTARALAFTAIALCACTQEPALVGSNCDQPGSCAEEHVQPLERIDEVDILLVVDSSGSIQMESEALKAQLPRMLNAIVTGSDADTSFPPASSVHVAVTTSDIGIGGIMEIEGCQGAGDDGVFLQPGLVGVTCEVDYPGYLAYDGGPAALATVDTVSCVPLTGTDGCGFEQPLEAGLKALWPASDPSVAFVSGTSHGEGANAGFLRPRSLLVVVVVTDEDDCSAQDLRLFTPARDLDPSDPVAMQDLNLRCFHNPANLYAPERYVENYRALRPDNDNVIFAVIGGIPPELVSDAVRASYDFSSPEQVAAFYDAVLAAPEMAPQIDPNRTPEQGGNLLPSCHGVIGEEGPATAYPPRRLVEVAKGFGASGVLASICDDDFGGTTGAIIRAIGERLIEAAGGAPDAG